MIQNREKFELIFELNGFKSEHVCQITQKLLKMLISDLRQLNDFVSPSELGHNQGKIAAYRELLDYIERGVPSPKVI